MKFISIKGISTGLVRSFLRFPLAIITAIIGSSFAIYMLERIVLFSNGNSWIYNIIHACLVGMALLIAVVLFGERRGWNKIVLLIIQLIVAGLIVLYYFFLPEKILVSHIVRSILLGAGFHLLVSFAPFIGHKEVNGFWQFNKTLFIRLLTGVLYTGVLYLGLSLAILAVDNLFKVNVDGEIYAQLWFAMVGVFNTWFFLAGIPEKPEELDAVNTYPLGLKIFTQYVLIPIVSIYLVILYAYMAKIIFVWQWPVGWVSWLVIGFSVTGIFSLLLVYPVQFNEGNRWIRVYSRAFYIALLPLIGLLSFAIWKRISEYGITENRYFVVVLAVWLLGISLYLIFTKLRNIRMIPVSLCLIALLSSFGPWGTFSISLNNQKNRLEQILVKNHILSNGMLVKTTSSVPLEESQQISSMVEYITSVHGYSVFQPWCKTNLDSLFVDSLYKNECNEMLGMMGLEYISIYDIEQHISENFYFAVSDGRYAARNVTGYDMYFPVSSYYYTTYDNIKDTVDVTWYYSEKDSFGLTYNSADMSVQIGINDSTGIKFRLDTLVDALRKKFPHVTGAMTNNSDNYNLRAERMTYTGSDSTIQVKFVFSKLNGQVFDKKRVYLNGFDADVYIRLLKDTLR